MFASVTVGIKGFYMLNNNGRGAIEFNQTILLIKKCEKVSNKISRIDGNTGTMSCLVKTVDELAKGERGFNLIS